MERNDEENVTPMENININNVRSEEKYIIENLINRISDNSVNFKISKDDIEGRNACYLLRRMKISSENFIHELNNKKKSAIIKGNLDSLSIINDFLLNIDHGIKNNISSRIVHISSYIYMCADDINSYVKGIKLKREMNPNFIKNTPVMMFWVRFDANLKVNFLGTRLNNSKENSADIFQLFTNSGTPVNYFFQMINEKVEEIVNSEDFIEENKELIFKGETYNLREYIDPVTRHIPVSLDIRGIKNPSVYKFADCDDNNASANVSDFILIKKKIEEHELISTINSFQLKLFVTKETSVNGTIIIWCKTSLAV